MNTERGLPVKLGSFTDASKNWRPHSPPFLAKVNVDAAWKKGSSNRGMGIIIRGQSGESIVGASLLSSHNSVVEVEAEVVVRGLQLAAHAKLSLIVVEGDCLEVMDALINHSSDCNWRISLMIRKSRKLVACFSLVEWNWVPREANRMANAAEKLAMARLSSSDWVGRPPTSLVHVLRSDGLTGPPLF
ncbi:uncharacterized protein LOC126784007 [Argentina anserina]|uniref:uncharacterized protein LOC126784007 n=1 Tax=Argentina anserina TaxID=57926 RepID=UPI0021762AE1|nr:uncharacterized protein LOC126784007 [Potentilla anserina]